VNDGAEIFASGSICVWGRLKGVAHAGLDGHEEHTVIAGVFEAKQVRIGGKSARLSDVPWNGGENLLSLPWRTILLWYGN